MTSPAKPGAAAPAMASDVFLREMDGQLAGWNEPAERLREALARNELTLYCQPILALDGGGDFTLPEVLVRMREEEKALLPPGEFLPVFEHYRLMPDLDRWVVRRALQYIKKGFRDSRISRLSINVSSQSIADAAFPKAVAQELHNAGLPGSSLLFEIDESDSMLQLDAAVRFAAEIRAAGCGLMVDGFGRRSASFAGLMALKVDFVKIDGVITRKILTSPAAQAKLKAIVRVGEVLEFRTIAEMVEEQEVLFRLKAHGVDYAQGFGIREPHPIELIAR